MQLNMKPRVVDTIMRSDEWQVRSKKRNMFELVETDVGEDVNNDSKRNEDIRMITKNIPNVIHSTFPCISPAPEPIRL